MTSYNEVHYYLSGMFTEDELQQNATDFELWLLVDLYLREKQTRLLKAILHVSKQPLPQLLIVLIIMTISKDSAFEFCNSWVFFC